MSKKELDVLIVRALIPSGIQNKSESDITVMGAKRHSRL